MSTENKNGKRSPNNMYQYKLILILALILSFAMHTRAAINDKKWIVVIDAGHGGKDPGALGSFSYEKNITLPIALKTGQYIEQNIRNVSVVYTRKTDKFIDIRDRAEIANKNNADLFISIHANWAKAKNIQGTETYIMGLAKDEQNLEVAMKENEVILLENDYTSKYEGFDPKSPESYIMFTLMQNIYQEQSTGLASRIQSQYKERSGRSDRGVKQAGFWVLFMTTMPSVLTETGFITNPAEEKFLNSKDGQDYIASAIFRACKEYISEIDKKSIFLSVNNQREEAITRDSTPVLSVKSVPEQTVPIKAVPDSTEVLFRVQVAASVTKKQVRPENFKGIADITEIQSQERFRYTTGSFPDYLSAVRYRRNIEQLFPDAFVIAVRKNKILPLPEALEIVKTNQKLNEKNIK
jgi:N-acetylmuramoyl-L-alanine amidase